MSEAEKFASVCIEHIKTIFCEVVALSNGLPVDEEKELGIGRIASICGPLFTGKR
jgi:hypothetical protein